MPRRAQDRADAAANQGEGDSSVAMMKRSNQVRSVGPMTEPGERIYVVGDIHGRFDLLRDLLDRIETHMRGLPPAEMAHIVFLGDLVDRGPDSAKVLGYLYDLQRNSEQIIILQGNHEDAMLRALDGNAQAMRLWLGVGGLATLRSFGLDRPVEGEDMRAYIQRVNATISREWIEWIRRMPLTAQSGDYFFCHAGVRPGVPLKRQVRTDLLWIRDDFLEDNGYHGAVIVHGHSISADVELRPNRIGIDTGAYRSGILTALYLEGEAREILATNGRTVMLSPEEAGSLGEDFGPEGMSPR